MSSSSEATTHSIGFLRVFGDGAEVHQGQVSCPRVGGSVPLERCARCPRFVKVTPGETGGQETVHCHTGACTPEVVGKPLSIPRASVADLMTRNVVCIRPDLTLDAATTLFLETSVSALPVVDDEGRLHGFLGQDEVTLAVHLRAPASERPLRVADVLLPFAVAVPETTSLTQAAAVMVFEGQHRLAITASDGSVVGVLTACDLLYWLARCDGLVLPPPRSACRL